MINVLFIESGRHGGGSSESLYQHLRIIDRNNIQPTVVTLNNTKYVSLIKQLRIPVHVLTDRYLSLHAPNLTRTAAIKLKGAAIRLNNITPFAHIAVLRLIHMPLINKLSKMVQDLSIDIVHLNIQIYRDFFGVFLTERTGVLCISHLRSADLTTEGQFNPKMARLANTQIAFFISNSLRTAKYWWGHEVDRSKTQIVHNGVPENNQTPIDVKKTWALQNNSFPILGCVSHLRSRVKMDEFLLKSFTRFLKEWPNAILLIIGDGPMKRCLEQEADTLGIRKKVIFAGFQKDPTRILAGCDVSLEMQTMDSFSRVALETMQAGVPLVANDVGGIRELVKDGNNGLLIEYGNEHAFVGAVGSAVSDKRLRSKLIKSGYETVKNDFSITRYASDMERIYVDIAGKK